MKTIQKYFISLIRTCKVSKKTALLRCIANQVDTGDVIPTKPAQAISSNFSPKIQLGPNWQHSTTKMDVARMRCGGDIFRSISYHLYYHIRSGKRHLCSVVTPIKSAQSIRSIFSPKIQLGSNWQQSTTTTAVTGLKCNADSSSVFHIIDTII